MRFDGIAALLTLSSVLLGASAGPLVAKRQDGSTSAASATATASSTSSDEPTSSISQAPTVGLVVGTMSDGKPTTFEVIAPNPTKGTESATEEATKTTDTATWSRTGQAKPPSTAFPTCGDGGKPFCLPQNKSDIYVGKTYYATWNPDFFPSNSTITVKLMWENDTDTEVWTSPETKNSWGFVAVQTKNSWLQGYQRYNLTFFALMFEGDDPDKKMTPYEGPQVLLRNEPPRHLQPPQTSKVHKQGLLIGLPLALGLVLVVVVGLFIGMRKHRSIGLGNIMGKRNRGYGAGKSKRQRLGIGKKGAIRLDERENINMPQYQNGNSHAREESLGSLVSDDEHRPTHRGNQFRDEIERQRTGR